MTSRPRRLRSRAPSLREQRDGRHLFVWGDLGQWLVLDAEAAALLDAFEQERDVDDALASHARRSGQSFDRVAREATPILDALH